MTIRKAGIPTSFALAAFLACSTSAVLVAEVAAPQQAWAQEVDVGVFYSNLAPHGQWFYQANFGWVWHPRVVDAGWRPYTDGQWVWSDGAGWVWASQEPWGWATYHYGRWYFDPMYGWSWVPGRVWAPAWVSWRVQSGYVGWAPLWPSYFDTHPQYRWDRWDHDRDWDRRHRGRDWDRWVFTRDRDFTSSRVGRLSVRDRSERDRIFRDSRDVTRWDEQRPDRMGYSIDRRMIEKAVGRPVRSVSIEQADRPGDRNEPVGDRLRMYRPRIQDREVKTPDRLGLAKEPSREPRETDTLREEKKRIDSMPEKERQRVREEALREGRAPRVREKDEERGGAPAAVERERSIEPQANPRERGAAPATMERERGDSTRGKADAGKAVREKEQPKVAPGAGEVDRRGERPDRPAEPSREKQPAARPESKRPAEPAVRPDPRQRTQPSTRPDAREQMQPTARPETKERTQPPVRVERPAPRVQPQKTPKVRGEPVVRPEVRREGREASPNVAPPARREQAAPREQRPTTPKVRGVPVPKPQVRGNERPASPNVAPERSRNNPAPQQRQEPQPRGGGSAPKDSRQQGKNPALDAEGSPLPQPTGPQGQRPPGKR